MYTILFNRYGIKTDCEYNTTDENLFNKQLQELQNDSTVTNIRTEKQKTITAKIQVYNGGHYGTPSIYEAEIIPQYHKNGKLKTTVFDVVRIIKTLKKGYNYGNAFKSPRIVEILDSENENN